MSEFTYVSERQIFSKWCMQIQAIRDWIFGKLYVAMLLSFPWQIEKL